MEGFGRAAWKTVKGIIFALFTCLFALVGGLIGMVVGALLGQEKEIGMANAAKIGAFNGVVVSMEILESSVAGGPLSLVTLFGSIMNGKSFQEWIRLATQTAQRWQDSMVDPLNVEDSDYELITRGMSTSAIKNLPDFTVSGEGQMNAGEDIFCAICLQELHEHEVGRSLSCCKHNFHLTCIDKWLAIDASCPICRYIFS